jgi:hypothetical protein
MPVLCAEDLVFLSDQNAGRLSAQGLADSNAAAARSTPSSSERLPTICRPTGSPESVNPQGTLAAGLPLMLKG